MIDEFIGQSVPLLFFYMVTSFTEKDIFYFFAFISFILFRFFDIFKIFPSNYFDKHYKNGYGVILDDIIAGIYTVLTLIILNAFI